MGFKKLRSAWKRLKKFFIKKKDVVISTSVGTSTDMSTSSPVDYETTNERDDQFLQRFLLKKQKEVSDEKRHQQNMRFEMAELKVAIKRLKATIASKKEEIRAKEEARGYDTRELVRWQKNVQVCDDRSSKGPGLGASPSTSQKRPTISPKIGLMLETQPNSVEESLVCRSRDSSKCKSVSISLRQTDIVSAITTVVDDDIKFPTGRPDNCRGESVQQNRRPCESPTPSVNRPSRNLRTYSYQSSKGSWRKVSPSNVKKESSIHLKTRETGPLLNFTPFDLPRQRRVECYSNHFMTLEREQIMRRESCLPKPAWPSISPKDHQQVNKCHTSNTCESIPGSQSSSAFTPNRGLAKNYCSQTGIGHPTTGLEYSRSQTVGLLPHLDLAHGKSRTLNGGNTAGVNVPSQRPRSVLGIHSLHSSTRQDAGLDRPTSELHINRDFLDGNDDDLSSVGSSVLSIRSLHFSTKLNAGRDKATSEFHINLDFLDEDDDDQSSVGSSLLSVRSLHSSTKLNAGRDKATSEFHINLDFLDDDDDDSMDEGPMTSPEQIDTQRTVEHCDSPDIVYRTPRPSMVTYTRIGESGDTCTYTAQHSHTGASGMNGMTSVED
ncbi:unnamed protein product [Owenia fusiformis]|uniref:Uncharacterized protein n=1 Tax=Owenia fusiformis TaxID=6347 RepID=A0A8S4N6P2_OWEFU|nr:unnamed protein product [Owenia fusiformis]